MNSFTRMGSSSSAYRARDQQRINRQIDIQLINEKREDLVSPKLLLLGR